MQVFKTDRKVFWTNEIKSWFVTFAIVTLFYFCLQLLFAWTSDKLDLLVVVMLILKIGDTLKQYHVYEIHVDTQENQLTFKLRSLISGEKEKKYKLGQVQSHLIHHSAVTKLLYSSVTLKLLLPPKDTFRINSRYGFSVATLTSVDNTFKQLNASVMSV